MNCHAYSVVDIRTDMIEFQARTLKTFSLDHTKLVVLDNTPKEREHLQYEIKAQCLAHGAEYFKVPYEVQNHNTANEAHAHALEWAWPNVVLKQRPPLVMLLDFDLFLCKPFSLSAHMKDAHFSGWAQGPGGTFYVWPGLLMVSLDQIPEPETISLYCGKIGDVHVDVGGQLHNYLKAHPELVMKGVDSSNRHFEETIAMLPQPSRNEYREFMAPHEQKFGVDFFHNKTFLHYVGATGWNHPPEDLAARKTAWIFRLLNNLMDGTWKMP